MTGPATLAPAAAGLNTAAFVTALPSNSDASSALAGHPTNLSNFDVGGTSDMLALGVFQHVLASDSVDGAPHSFTGSILLQFDIAQLANPAQRLLLGLLNPIVATGFDTLRFSYTVEDAEASQTFTSLATAQSFFNDQTLDLGDLGTLDLGTNNLLDIAFGFDATITSAGQGFGFDFALGNATFGSNPIPLPGAVWLLGSGLIGLLGWRGRRRDVVR